MWPACLTLRSHRFRVSHSDSDTSSVQPMPISPSTVPLLMVAPHWKYETSWEKNSSVKSIWHPVSMLRSQRPKRTNSTLTVMISNLFRNRPPVSNNRPRSRTRISESFWMVFTFPRRPPLSFQKNKSVKCSMSFFNLIK